MIYTKARYTQEENDRELKNRHLSYLAATEGVVLLKNDNVLPLKTKKVALFGPGAVMTIKGGTGSGEVKERRVISILDGMLDCGFEITTLDYLENYRNVYYKKYDEFKKMKKRKINLLNIRGIMSQLAEEFQAPAGDEIFKTDTEICLYVLSRQAGEAGDRKLEKGDYYLSSEEYKQIQDCTKLYEKTILIINAGSSIDMSFVDDLKIDGILFIAQLGMEGGLAVADILSGKVNPSGKLAATWVNKYEDIPFGDEYAYLGNDLSNAYYKEDIYVGYRYYDSFSKEVRYPFGFGLSYSDFKINFVNRNINKLDIKLEVSVKNIGDYAGKEIVQLYLSKPTKRLGNVYQELVAFNKTKLLNPGELETFELSFNLADFASYDESKDSYILEAGSYTLRLGNSSRNTRDVLSLILDNDLVISTHKEICKLVKSFEVLTTKIYSNINISGIDKVILDTSDIKTIIYDYSYKPNFTDENAKQFVDSLSLREKAEVLVGDGLFLFSDPIFHLPGSVGNTTSKLWDKGLCNVAFCDGPAGIRLQKESGINKKNKIKPIEMPIGFLEFLPGFVKKILKANPKKDKMVYQYTTSFPVATALAQTWNKELLYEVGCGILSEMEEYGCTYWLAPAVNIQVNPLCGRNFEYFSEDPFLAGKLASYIIKGVQSKEGFYATVKHFACNNQETNREHSNSNVSERALREIYTKAFMICVKEAKVKSVMTSYNLVNGVYTPNSYDLCTKLLRCEWGFDGVVMTDWYASKKGQASHALAIKAGNDLIMPGEANAKREILKAVKKGILTEEEITMACYNIVKQIFESQTYKEYVKKGE